jgi:UDP-N-acetylglucosamine 2-epimerase (non-hydrolysing)
VKYLVVLGTRPEIIKMAPVIRELHGRGHKPFIVHTGQHYSNNMDQIFWKSLDLPMPAHRLGSRDPSLTSQTAAMMQELEGYVAQEKPDWVIVHGDTNSTLSGALVAAKQAGVRIAHVEAGLRSFDRTMPEEVNRVVVDHLSDLLFAPTPIAVENLENEGIGRDRIQLVGNTIEDVVRQNIDQARALALLNDQPVHLKPVYAVLTLHRAENTASSERLGEILTSVFESTARLGLQLLFSVHPRTKILIEQMELEIPAHVKMLEPLGYFEFLALLDGARLIATDSGGLQEEACLLGRPCITLRENTERPETVALGCNILGGVRRGSINHAFEAMMKAQGPWQSPYGNGLASKRIVDLLEQSRDSRIAKVDAGDMDTTIFRIQADATAALQLRGIR